MERGGERMWVVWVGVLGPCVWVGLGHDTECQSVLWIRKLFIPDLDPTSEKFRIRILVSASY